MPPSLHWTPLRCDEVCVVTELSTSDGKAVVGAREGDLLAVWSAVGLRSEDVVIVLMIGMGCDWCSTVSEVR